MIIRTTLFSAANLLRCCALAAGGALLAATAAAQTEAVWMAGTEGNWSDSLRWSTLAPPNNGSPAGATYNVTIPGPSGTTRITQDIVGGVTIENLTLSGFLTLNNPLTLNQKLTLNGGGVAGNATLTVGGQIDWQAGSLASGGVVNASGGVLLSGSGFKQLGRTLNNAATTTWTGGGVTMLHGAVFQNLSGATFDAQSGSSFTASGGASAFNNAGSFTKSAGTGLSSLTGGVAFNNSGTVQAQTGTLGFFGGGTSSGSFVVSSGAQLSFAGDHNLQAAASVTGEGTVAFTGSTALGSNLVASTYDVTNTVISGGRNDFNSNATTGTATLSGNSAVLRGSGTFTSTGAFSWTGGTMAGTGITRTEGGLAISGSATKTLGRALENASAASWSDSGNVEMLDGGVFDNTSAGTFTAQNDSSFVLASGATAASFVNAGTFTKSDGLGTTSFGAGVSFTNSGTVEAQSGTIGFNGGYTQSAGSLVLNGGSVSASSPLDINGGSVAGSGTINASIANGGDLSPRAPDAAGMLIVSGDLVFEDAARFTIEIGGRLPTEFDRVTSGATTLAGFLDVSFINGFEQGLLGIAATDAFTILDASSLSGAFANAPNGGRVATSDGIGSFAVSYTTSDVVLSDFQAVPEPGTYALLGLGTAALLVMRRRKASRN